MLFLSLLFWAFLASFVVHILDESLVNSGFVEWIRDNFWPTYHARMFFWFNAAAIAAIAAGNCALRQPGRPLGHPPACLGGWVRHPSAHRPRVLDRAPQHILAEAALKPALCDRLLPRDQ